MSRNKAEVEHPMAAKNRALKMADNMSGAFDKIKELDEETAKEVSKPVKTNFNSLKDLLVFGKVTETVNFSGISISLSTLTNKQQKQLVTRLMKLGPEERLMNAKAYTLAEAVISINGIMLADLCDLDLPDDQKRIEVVSELQSTLVDVLFERYEVLIKQSNDCYKTESNGDDIKN